MKELSRYKIKKFRKNLEDIFLQATDEEISKGIRWYYDVHGICKELGIKYNIQPYKVAEVISALSPRNRWEQNIKDAETVIQAHQSAIHPAHVRVCTFNSNKLKAFSLLNGQRITIKSPKTYSFVNNIGKLDDRKITIDIWHLRACEYKLMKIRQSPGVKAYNQIQEVTLDLAKQYGLKGFEFQGVVWLATQRILNKA